MSKRGRAATRGAEQEPPPIVVAYALAYRCPDCIAQTELGVDDLGIWHLAVRHDDTCPTLARIEGRRS